MNEHFYRTMDIATINYCAGADELKEFRNKLEEFNARDGAAKDSGFMVNDKVAMQKVSKIQEK